MATRIIGKVAFRPRGEWNNLVSDYERLDTVVADNVMYIALQSVPTGTPVSNSTYWQRNITGSGGSGQLDTEMSDVSTNGVQNKVIKEYVDGGLRLKVTKENGKGLSANDFTDTYKNKIGSGNLETVSQNLTGAVNEVNSKLDSLTTDVSAKASTEYVNGELDKKVDLTSEGANALITSMGSSTNAINDNQLLIASSGTGYFKRKFSLVWDYIKSKILGDTDIVKASDYFYQNGDVVQTNLVSCPAFLTGSSKTVIFSLPISKSLENINSVTINSLKGGFRSSEGYLHGQTTTTSEWLGLENITITVDIEKPTNTLLFRIAISTAYTNAPANNTPMSYYGSVKLTLSGTAPKTASAPVDDTTKK